MLYYREQSSNEGLKRIAYRKLGIADGFVITLGTVPAYLSIILVVLLPSITFSGIYSALSLLFNRSNYGAYLLMYNITMPYFVCSVALFIVSIFLLIKYQESINILVKDNYPILWVLIMILSAITILLYFAVLTQPYIFSSSLQTNDPTINLQGQISINSNFTVSSDLSTVTNTNVKKFIEFQAIPFIILPESPSFNISKGILPTTEAMDISTCFNLMCNITNQSGKSYILINRTNNQEGFVTANLNVSFHNNAPFLNITTANDCSLSNCTITLKPQNINSLYFRYLTISYPESFNLSEVGYDGKVCGTGRQVWCSYSQNVNNNLLLISGYGLGTLGGVLSKNNTMNLTFTDN